ncbi:hypothetical protein BDR06DRAFT_977618 [Suillus hirtellus]|nr:hypothetical protein BDR06DRAFT_977618 [Suillus hirtellus]
MSHLMTFVSSYPDSDNPDPSVELYSLHKLCPVHTYPPQPITTSVHAYPPKPAALPNEDFAMSLHDPWETIRRPRDDDSDCPTKVLLKEVDQSARLCNNIRELQYSKHELLLRKCYAQRNANSQKFEMQSIIDQYHQKLESLELKKNQMTLGINEVQNTAHMERDHVLAEKEAVYLHETTITREKMLVENEMELTHLTAQYNFKNASLDVHIIIVKFNKHKLQCLYHHLHGIISQDSDSPVDKESQITGNGDAGHPLTSLLADVLIKNATVKMLVEALTKSLQHQQITFHPGPHSRLMFHLMKDEDYMLYSGASQEAITSFIDGMGHGPDPLMLQWDIMAIVMSSKYKPLLIPKF